MNLTTFKQHGVYLEDSQSSRISSIPLIADVLYILQISREQTYITYARSACLEYIQNTTLIAAVVAPQILGSDTETDTDLKKGQKIIAEAICSLTPPRARCLFDRSYLHALEVALGKPVDPSNYKDKDGYSSDCTCDMCSQRHS